MDTDNTFGAKLGLAEAITSGKSPEQTAADLQFARRLKMPAGYVQSMPPEDRAAEEVNLQDWATLQATTPVLMQKMTEPSFANLVKDSITDVGLLEATWWKISPNPGQQDGWLTTFRNSLARGGYQLPSQFAERALEDTSAELNRIRETETALAEGRSIKELFGSETDPEGDVGYKLFMANKDAQKEYLRQRALANSTTLAFSNRMAGLFPQSKAMEELREQQTLGDALGVFAQNPLSIIADVGPESLLRNAPQLAAMAAAAPAGVIPAALGAGAGSYQAEYAAAVPEAMKELGLDITKPEDIVAFYTNPENKQVLQSSQEKARQRASAVAAFDALSAGLASTMLVPKMVAKHFGTRTVEATNLVSQAAVQGALGGAGEALGQYAADGEIKSWADVVAEFAGEFTTAPVDVMAAATKVSVENGGMKVSAEQFAVDTARLEDYAKTSTLLQRDPQSFADYVKAVQEQHPDTNAIYVDAQALHQAGGDALMQATPELAARYDRALKEGGDLQLTVEEFMTQVAPRDANNLMAETAHPEGFPSLAEARQLEVDLSQEITDRLSQSVSDKDLAFQQSSAAVGDTIGTMLRDAFQDPEKIGKRADPGMMTTTQIQTVQAYLQTLVNNMAADSGMTPEQVWSKYGARGFLGPKDVKRGDKGGIVPVSERAKSLLTPKAKDNLSQEATEARKAAGPRYERLSGVRKPDSATVPVIELGELERLSQNGEKLSDFLYRELAGQTLTIKATGQNVLISKAGLKRSLKKRTAAHHAVYGRLVNVIESAEYDGTEKNDREKSHFTDQDVYHSAVRIGGKLYAVRVKVDVATPREKHLQNKGLQKTKFDARYADHQVAEIDVSEVKESPVGNGSDEPDGLGSQGVASARNAVADRTDTVTLGVIRGLVKPHAPEEGVLYQDTLGEYLPDARVIVQWANANRSTFLHETGHLFLNMRVAMARDLKAAGAMTASQQYAVQATEDALKWLGTDIETFSKMTLEEQRPLHEKFARTYEAYLMEGQSPNKGLTKLFRRFTSWLKSVYSTVDAIPGQAISDDVREIFDRLMTASAYAEEAKARRAQYAAFKNADEARMSAELWEEYQQRQKEASEASVQELTEKLSRDAKRFANLRRKKLNELTAKARATYDALFDAYWGAVKNSKAFKAHNLLIEGKLADGKLIQPKLVERELKTLGLSEADLRMLDNLGLVAKKSPMGGEAVAQAQGYDSFDAMVHDLLKLGDPVQAVRDQTATAMLERYGEMSTPKKIQEAADLAVFNESRLRVIEAEVKAFNTALGNKIENLQIFRAGAKQRVAGYKLGELRRRTHDHAVAAGRRARDSDKARKAGQTQEAAALKNQQAWQSVLVKEGKDQFETVRRQLKAFKKYTKEDAIRGIDPQYLVLVQHILAKIGEGREFPVNDTQRDMIMGFMANGEFRGPLEGVADLADAPIELLRRIEEGQYPGVEELTCEEFSDLAGVLTELITQGKNAAAMTVAGKKVEFKQIRHELAEAVETQAGIRGREKRDEREKTGRAAQIADALRAIGMSHARIPSLLAAMEGTRFGGMFKYIVRPAQECDSRERELVNKYTQAIFDILGDQLSKLAGTRRKYFENPGVSLTRQEIFTMALNMGNAGNKQRLLDNSSAWSFMDGRTLTEEEVKGLISSELTTEDLQSVQKIWDLFDDLRRLIEEKELRKRGRIPKWVEPEAFDVLSSDGQVVHLRGGYYPIVYDRKASSGGEQIDDMKGAQDALRASRGMASVYKGHLKSRAKKVDAGRPLTLTLRGLFEGFNDAIHDVCWDEWVGNTRRILQSDGAFDRAIRDYWGADADRAVKQWHRDIATRGEGSKVYGDTLANVLRSHVSLVGVGFNLVTAAIQPLAITQTAAVLGGKWTAKGIGEFLAMGPKKASQFAASKSRVMADRARTQFREIAEVQSMAAGNTSQLASKFMRAAYFPIVMAQMLVDIPTWLGAYNKALSEGQTDSDAVAIADRTLQDAQGSGNLSELSGIERGNAWSKLFTVYYTFFNTALQIAMVSGHTKGKLAAARDIMLVLMIQPIAETFLREALKVGDDDGESSDEYWKRMGLAAAGNVAEFNMGLFVGLREAGAMVKGLVTGDYEQYRGPTALRKITDTTSFLTSIRKDIENGELDERTIRQAITVTAEWTGWPIPIVPVTRAIKGHAALEEGKTDNEFVYLLGYSDY